MRRFWRRHRWIILISLVVYAVATLLLILGSWEVSDVPFNYQIR